ncbi:MAG: hypothetical protein IJU98_08385 [Synergistaceae bacterium]|nr:hypothetical protein [Synergistaceae bacterium]
MSKSQDRKAIVAKINNAAVLYKHNLVGRRFLYVFENRYIEVIYKAENFRHLTGIDTHLSAKAFYNYASKKILAASQIYFSALHPYDLCVKKVQHITDIAALTKSDSFMLEEIRTNTTVYNFGATDLNFTLCFNKEFDDEGTERGECFVAQSLRDGDCFSKSKAAFAVTHIFSKKNDKVKYDILSYLDKSSSIKHLPNEIKGMLSDNLLEGETTGEVMP